MKIRILGCGTSAGVPALGNRWGLCDPKNPKNKRLRTSALVQVGDKNILIDSSPDLRYQLMRENIGVVHAVIYTHQHADHTHGINDLGPISRINKFDMPIYANRETLEDLKAAFGYAFHDPENGHYHPFLLPQEIDETPFDLFGHTVQPFEQDHGIIKSLGFRIGDFAYSTDVCKLSPSALERLQGIKVWVVDCLQRDPHGTHSYLDQTLEWIAHVKPERAILTHMSNTLDYQTLKADLPEGVEPAYDGMILYL